MERNTAFVIEKVSTFSPSVYQAVQALVTQLDEHFQPLSEKDFQSILSSDSTQLFIAKRSDTDTIVGMITLIIYRIPYKKKAWLEDFVVDQSVRGQGIGTQLLNQAKQTAKDAGVHTLYLTSRPTRQNAIALYEQLGFQKRETNVYYQNV